MVLIVIVLVPLIFAEEETVVHREWNFIFGGR
jgi:hypothetical protein